MKKVISVLVIAMIYGMAGLSLFGKPSVGYVLVGPKKRWWLVNETLSRI